MLNIKTHFSNNWLTANNIYIRGTMFEDDYQLSSQEMLEKINSLSITEVVDFLCEINGFFSVISIKENEGWMAVDRIRSFPIFYGKQEDQLFISDDARWIKEQVKDRNMDPVAQEEFFLTGFVTGSDSLFTNVKQMQAGEVIFFCSQKEGNISIKSQRYYHYSHDDYFDMNEDSLLGKLDNMMSNVFHRLITFAKGRTIVVPLSGGYDSRVIVLMLKRLSYKNVIAFSYGRSGNKESVISNFVANDLKTRWEFIEYSNELWRSWFNTLEMKEYFDMAGNFSALPHIQDWPAVRQLKNKLSSDAIFVPGISADLNTGGFIEKYPAIYRPKATENDLLELIINYSYELHPFDSISVDTQSTIKQKILKIIGARPYDGTMGERFECWVSTEKVAKFVLNSVRAYEFFGFDWWTPYWNSEFVNFWYNVPHELRNKQKLYKAYLVKITKDLNLFGNIDPLFRDNRLPKQLNLEFTGNSFDRKVFARSVVHIIKRILPNRMEKSLKKIINLYSFKGHPLQWYGIHDDEYIFRQIQNGATHINSILVIDYIDYLKNKVLYKSNLYRHFDDAI